jgi:hypothetical protein
LAQAVIQLWVFNFIRRDIMKDLHTVNELADALKVPKSWIYARTRETGPKSIPHIKVGKYLRFEINKVLDWLKVTYSIDSNPQ